MRISIVLEALTADFQTDMKRAEKSLEKSVREIEKTAKQVGVAVGAALASAVTALGALGVQAINSADKLYDASQRTGVMVKALSQLKYAAEQSGTSFEAVEKGLQKLAREADSGGKNLARIGVSATDAAGRMRPMDEILLDVSERFAGMGNATEKVAAAQAIFGKASAALIPMLSEGKAGLQAFAQEADRLGVTVSDKAAKAAAEFNDNLDKLKSSAVGLGNDIAAELLPALLDVTNAAVEFVKQIREDGTLAAWIQGIKDAAKYIDELAVFIATRLVAGALVSLISALATATTGFGLAAGAANVFKLALALAGGPVGIIVTAVAMLAVGLYSLESPADRAARAIEDYKGVLAGIDGMAKVNADEAMDYAVALKTEAIAHLQNAKAVLEEKRVKLELANATDRILRGGEDIPDARANSAGIAWQRAQEEAKKYTAQIEALNGKIIEIGVNDAFDRLGKGAKGAAPPVVILGDSAEETASKAKLLEQALARATDEEQRMADWTRQLSEAANSAAADMGNLAAGLAADLGGPAVQAAQEYARTLDQVKANLAAMAALAPLTADQLTQAAFVSDAAWLKYQKTLEGIGKQEAEAASRADTVANRVASAWTQAADQMAYAWGDLLTGQFDKFSDFANAIKQIWLRAVADMIAASARSNFAGMLGNGSGAGIGAGGAATAAGGAGGMLGSLLGAAGGMLGGTGFGTGLLASGSIFSGAGLLGGITGSISAGVSSILGGSIMQGVGLLAGPVGLIAGAVMLLTSVIKKDKPPDFRVGGTNGRVRGVEGNFDTVFGQVNAGSRQISWESLVEPMQQFDLGIQQLVQTMGGGQPQIDAIRDTLSRWVVDLKGDAATAENVLGSRFSAVLTTFSTDIQSFVGTVGTVQERLAKLTDALAIEKIVDTGALGETFAEVSALLTEYRTGTEAIADTYGRVLGSVMLLDEALSISGTSLDLTRAEMIRFATDITEAAGGLERAQSLWSAYFETFYTADERAAYALQRAQANAATQAGDIGLNASDFAGAAGAQQFRDLFETMLPTLSAEAVVQWLEFAQALGVVLDLTGEVTEAVTETAAQVSTSLTDLMASVTEQLEQYAPPQTFAQRLQAINVETDAMIAQARALGATEEQLGQIRALSAARLGEVLDEQAAAMADYQSIVQGINDEIADASGLSDFGREMREINRGLADTTASLNAAARAAGLQGAAESDLAAAHELAAIRAAAAIARLEERGRSVVQELYGTPLERLNEQIAAIEAGIGGFAGGVSGGMEQVTQATDNAVQAQLGAQQRIRDWLDNLMLGDLGGLRPRDALAEAQTLFDRTLASALGGDAEAMAALPGLADQLLRLGQRVYASGDPYFDLRDAIREALTQVAGLAVENPLPVGTGGGGIIGNDGGFGGNGNGDVSGLYAERDRLMAEQAAAERRALATELAGVIRDLVVATGQPLDEIETTLGFSMRDLVTDLGVNLNELTVATATQLADIAQATGTELTALASSVGVDLGGLADRQSLLNDALEADIAALPEGQRAALESLLRDVEEAAALGDTAGVERGIGDMEDAIGDMSEDIRDALAPYFIGIRPIDPVTELGHLSSMDTILSDSRGELQAHTLLLGNIYDVLNGPAAPSPPTGPLGPGGGFPGYAVGTAFVPKDGPAYLHRGEAVFPASVSEFFRREGIPTGGNQDALVAELRELRRERREGDEYTRRLEQRIQQLETTTARGDDAKVRAMDRQLDAMKRVRP